MPDGMTHLMMACMPSVIPKESAQAWWDAYDKLNVCLQDKSKKSGDCTDIALTSYEQELKALGIAAPPGLKPAMYVLVSIACTSARVAFLDLCVAVVLECIAQTCCA
jgi:hypothetical protein